MLSGNKLKKSDLSFVVQGPIIQNVTSRVTQSIRKYFNESVIIISTWPEQNLIGVEYDKLIINKDPGSFYRDDVNRILHNGNRQIVSTIEGLKAADTIFSVKIRSDIEFINTNLLDLLEKANTYQAYDSNWKFVKNRVLITNVTSVNPNKVEKIPFCPCDWIYAGFTSDLINIWSIPLFKEPEMTRWYETHSKPQTHPFPTSLALFQPEDFIWSSFIKKHRRINYNYLGDISGDNIEQSERSLANNLIIFNNKQLGIKCTKHPDSYLSLYRMYTHSDWYNLYARYCLCKKTNKVGFDNILSKTAFLYEKIYLTLSQILRKISRRILAG